MKQKRKLRKGKVFTFILTLVIMKIILLLEIIDAKKEYFDASPIHIGFIMLFLFLAIGAGSFVLVKFLFHNDFLGY
ncbi:hypothetical protein J4456_04925 [Candidatus Pacearchaeota archaeon]|nr:hypothetical protein [Candidatus Pacearchaeota archaeon]